MSATNNHTNSIICGDNINVMKRLLTESVDLIVTSPPPYFDIKTYGKQDGQIGNIHLFDSYISSLLKVWKECERVLVPNGKLIVNTPSMPIAKDVMDTHHNRHIYDINASIQHSIIHCTGLYLHDTYIWDRTNPTRSVMFGSYPYPGNLYSQNTTEYVTVYVKDGEPKNAARKKKKKANCQKKSGWNIQNKYRIFLSQTKETRHMENTRRLCCQKLRCDA